MPPRTGGWKNSPRASQLPPRWRQLRERVLLRDGHRCTWTLDDGTRCTAQATEVDHITPGNNHTLPNLRALCRDHHAMKSSREGHEAKAARPIRRPPEAHPGLK